MKLQVVVAFPNEAMRSANHYLLGDAQAFFPGCPNCGVETSFEFEHLAKKVHNVHFFAKLYVIQLFWLFLSSTLKCNT